MTRKHGRGNGRRFIQLWTNVKRSQAYHQLSHAARSALTELLDRYNGINNGQITLSVRELAYELNSSKDTASRALIELDDANLARPVEIGRFKGRKATTWRLTFIGCDPALGQPLPILNWKQRAQFASDLEDTTVRSGGHQHGSRPISGTRKRKSSMNGSGMGPSQ
jgi:hypothetical protein